MLNVSSEHSFKSGFSNDALNLMCSYLKSRKQRTQINNNFSSEKTIIAGVPQASIDIPLLVNLFINEKINLTFQLP